MQAKKLFCFPFAVLLLLPTLTGCGARDTTLDAAPPPAAGAVAEKPDMRNVVRRGAPAVESNTVKGGAARRE